MQYFGNRKSDDLKNSSCFGIVLNDDEQLFEEEARIIARILEGQHFPNATKQTVLSNISNKNFLHFSCHGYFASNLTQDKIDDFNQNHKSDIQLDTNPLSSGIILQDKVLTAKEMFNLRINAELVTLSACESGMNDRRPGDELISLTRSLLYAGASSVVVSLWSVAAQSTIQLMEEFYKQQKFSKKSKAVALQQAMIKIMDDKNHPEWKHPYFWAPFMLVGDWQ